MKRLTLLALCSLMLSSCGPTVTPESPDVTLRLGTPLNQSALGSVHLKADVQASAIVTGVTFYRGSDLLGVDRSAPYEFTDHLSSSGKYRYRALASVAGGAEGQGLLDVDITIPQGISELPSRVVEFGSLTGAGVSTSSWTGGAAEVVIMLPGAELSRSALNAAGAFQLKLPAPLAGQLRALNSSVLGLTGCTSEPTFSVPEASGVRVTVVTQGALNGRNGPIQPLTYNVTTVNGQPKEWHFAQGALLYADRPVEISGTATCQVTATSAGAVSFQLSLLPGWNEVTLATTVNASGAPSARLASGGLPGTDWIYGLPRLP